MASSDPRLQSQENFVIAAYPDGLLSARWRNILSHGHQGIEDAQTGLSYS